MDCYDGRSGRTRAGGEIKVSAVVSLAEAKRRLGRNDLWASRWHALAAAGTVRRMCGLSLIDVAHQLRFVDTGATQLFVSAHGGVSSDQLRRMRELDGASGRLLSQMFNQSLLMQAN